MLYHYVAFLGEKKICFSQLCLVKIHTYNFLKLTFSHFFRITFNYKISCTFKLQPYSIYIYIFIYLSEVNFDKFIIGLYLILISSMLVKF